MQRCENKAVIMSFMARQAGGGGGGGMLKSVLIPHSPLCWVYVCVGGVKGGLN